MRAASRRIPAMGLESFSGQPSKRETLVKVVMQLKEAFANDARQKPRTSVVNSCLRMEACDHNEKRIETEGEVDSHGLYGG